MAQGMGETRNGAALVAPRWRGTEEEWDELVGACLLACARHHPRLGMPGMPCSCADVLTDERLLDRLLYVRRTNARYLYELHEASAAGGADHAGDAVSTGGVVGASSTGAAGSGFPPGTPVRGLRVVGRG